MKTQKSDLSNSAQLMMKLVHEANLLALDVAMDAARGSVSNERILKIAEEIKKLADQAIEVRGDLLACISELDELVNPNSKL